MKKKAGPATIASSGDDGAEASNSSVTQEHIEQIDASSDKLEILEAESVAATAAVAAADARLRFGACEAPVRRGLGQPVSAPVLRGPLQASCEARSGFRGAADRRNAGGSDRGPPCVSNIFSRCRNRVRSTRHVHKTSSPRTS